MVTEHPVIGYIKFFYRQHALFKRSSQWDKCAISDTLILAQPPMQLHRFVPSSTAAGVVSYALVRLQIYLLFTLVEG